MLGLYFRRMRASSRYLTGLVFALGAVAEPGHMRFTFGPGGVAPSAAYDAMVGYGFEPGATVSLVTRAGESVCANYVTSARDPFYFSARVPQEGNYKVTVTMGDPEGESLTTVKAELRRLMLTHVATESGGVVSRSFIVNVRTPAISGGREVRLKDREKSSEAWAWDDRLTLEFADRTPAVCAIEIEKADDMPTLFIAGDSTSTDQAREPFNSWGQMLTRFFGPGIGVSNHGESGESARSFVSEKRWAKLMSVLRRGDYVMIQFAHNDQKEKGEGVGAFTTYKDSLKLFVQDVRERGATPILVTPMHRQTFDAEGKITNSLGDYPDAVRQLSREERVGLIDLNAMSKTFYEALGPSQVKQAFAGNDTTHHSDYGSWELAKCIVEGVKRVDPALAKFLISGLGDFDPAHPDPPRYFDLVREPIVTVQRPYGN